MGAGVGPRASIKPASDPEEKRHSGKNFPIPLNISTGWGVSLPLVRS
jgi:hypothetical protein